jgi:hypothetical protein
MSQDANDKPVKNHQKVKISARKDYVCYKRLRYQDRPQKRAALAEITVNKRQESIRTCTIYSYKQYDVTLCKKRNC